MSERYPDDSTLLALDQDDETGVEYIATGQSPYYLQFRKLVQRLILAARRANDFRVYQDGDLTVGVRAGRCVLNNAAVDYAGASGAAVSNNATTYVWIASDGTLTTGSALPTDRTTFLPLASVVSSAGAITDVTDLRGEAICAVPNLAWFGITATAARVNQALDGINDGVTATKLNALTAGATADADTAHRHSQLFHDETGEAELHLINMGTGSSANVVLKFDLPNILPELTTLLPDTATGWLKQRYGSTTYSLVGALPVQFQNEGTLTATLTAKLVGVVPADGVVSAVVLSTGSNIVSTVSTDGVNATVKVNGTALTSTDPKITSAAGSGFRSTGRGQGTAGVIKTDGTQNVRRGDVLTLDLTRTATGTVSTEMTNVVVLVVVRPSNPE